MLQGASAGAIALLAQMLEVEEFEDGEIVCEVGERASRFQLVVTGTLVLRESRARRAIAGEVVNPATLFGDHRCTTTLIAQGSTVVLGTTIRKVRQFFLRYPDILLQVCDRTILDLTGSRER